MSDTEATGQGDTETVNGDVSNTPDAGTPDNVSAPAEDSATPEATPDDTPAAEDGTGEDKNEDDAPTGAPEAYEAFTAPEGMDLNDAMTETFTGMAKDMNLSQAHAQSLVDFAATQITAGIEQHEAAKAAAWKAEGDAWVSEIKADKDLGGGRMGETIERAQRAIRTYGGPEVAKMLEDSGFGNNPHIVRMFVAMDKAVGEDSTVDGGVAGKDHKDKSLAEVWYPKN